MRLSVIVLLVKQCMDYLLIVRRRLLLASQRKQFCSDLEEPHKESTYSATCPTTVDADGGCFCMLNLLPASFHDILGLGGR